MLTTLIVLFVVYVAVTAWQMRRALAAPEGAAKQREAVRLLLAVTLGVPLAIAFIFVGW
jgi:heme/copper-type cytochrome/quinol oxidase subunit 2